MSSKYEVQTYTLCQGWINTWTIEEDDGTSRPEYFNSVSEAQEAIDDFLEETEEEVLAGNLAAAYNPDEYRVMEVKDEP